MFDYHRVEEYTGFPLKEIDESMNEEQEDFTELVCRVTFDTENDPVITISGDKTVLKLLYNVYEKCEEDGVYFRPALTESGDLRFNLE